MSPVEREEGICRLLVEVPATPLLPFPAYYSPDPAACRPERGGVLGYAGGGVAVQRRSVRLGHGGAFKSGDCAILACASGVSPVNKLVGSPLVGIFSLVISALLIW